MPPGKPTRYVSSYDRGLLYPIPRSDSRQNLGLEAGWPYFGVDIWTAWELTWLNSTGVPDTASVEIRVPCDTPQLIESKSLKLYLNSFAMSRFASAGAVQSSISEDLGDCLGGTVTVRLLSPTVDCNIVTPAGTCIDASAANCTAYDVDPGLLRAGSGEVSEVLHSHLLRSLCPVTGQPDLGSVFIAYRGPRIDRAALLHYIVSFREHADFHEACVERMFVDIRQHCRPTELSVYARYQRRGGIDINPFRSMHDTEPAPQRLWRQ